MKYISFTYIDSVTKVSQQFEESRNGPVFPEVVGLEYSWDMTSEYPTPIPRFFGTCPDDSGTDVTGVLEVLSQATWEALRIDEMRSRPNSPETSRKLRDKLLAESDWTQLPDSTADKAAWAVYRQSLRDLPSQNSFLDGPVWPFTPGSQT